MSFTDLFHLASLHIAVGIGIAVWITGNIGFLWQILGWPYFLIKHIAKK